MGGSVIITFHLISQFPFRTELSLCRNFPTINYAILVKGEIKDRKTNLT